MRVGKPIKAPAQPLCDYCGAKTALARYGDFAYPYQLDQGAVWICVPCQAWVAVRARSKTNEPVGRFANAELREQKAKLHQLLEPFVLAKMRRDGINVFKARAKALRWATTSAGLDETHSLHQLSLEDCRQVDKALHQYLQTRNETANGEQHE